MDRLAWLKVADGLGPIGDRRDVRELLIHVGPLQATSVAMVPDEWHVVLAVGAGLTGLSGKRVSDAATVITGTLRDHPSLTVQLAMTHRPDGATDPFAIERVTIIAADK